MPHDNPWEACWPPMLAMSDQLVTAAANQPQAFWAAGANWWQAQSRLWQDNVEKMLSDGKPEEYWQYFQQSHKLMNGYWQESIDNLEHVPGKDKKQLAFWARQTMQMQDPAHYLLTNPKVLAKTLEEGGDNLVRGLGSLVEDMDNSPIGLNIPLGNTKLYELGKDLATTPGQVVRQSPLFELIQYAPSTEQVHKTPVLVVPPCINKYYVLDLKPENSFVRHLVDQGHTVFLMSWVNPTAQHADFGMTEYMQGVIEAINWVRELTEENQVHAMGYCVGGTLLALASAWLAARGAKRIASLTLVTTLLDFAEPGEPGLLLVPALLKSVMTVTDQIGYMDGRLMATGFSLLREQELYWPAFVNRYLLGQKPPAFDILVWNSDVTHLPATFFREYIENTYLENRLAEPGSWKLDGYKMDLRRVNVPVYVLAADKDHIVPPKSAFASARLFGGNKKRLVTSGAGHVAGVVNPPAKNKYGYKVDGEEDAKPGSWWPDWYQWLDKQSDAMVPARAVPEGITPAPGQYVKVKI
ncbi:MAG: alpha/beta fold hydrolase [Pseudomonadota bacterium]|uniref:PHA/PHB synthase family protein n=1 Tax=Gallaecimonas pentaromativorans TaxID=584787 RepID=UPI00067EB824|nr:alpha/beta fold hydrolase [Gallaecimonas pentaromativorans]MED5526595.1 alpha/beta fold hydrolase [Pseudomonadota bacterium]